MKTVNLLKEANALQCLYVYNKVGILNEHVLSLVQVENRTLDFHIHETSDELFYVIEGHFILETKDNQFPVQHRPVVNSLTKFLMIELAGTLNKENSGDLYEG